MSYNQAIFIRIILSFIILFPIVSKSQTIKSCSPPPKLNFSEQGIVTVGMGIDNTGKLITAVILRSSGFKFLDNSALEIFKKCTFNPKVSGTITVDGKLQQTINFVTSNDDEEKDKVNIDKVRKQQYARTGFYPEEPNPNAEKIIDEAIKNYAENRNQQEKEEKRQAWLLTLEGQKYIAEEAMKKQKIEKELIAKKAEEQDKKTKIIQQCESMKNWAANSRELISESLKTSISSISLIRFKMGQYSCLAIVDTPKGPEKCVVNEVLQDKKTGEFYAYMGSAFNTATCDPMFAF